MMPTNRFDRTSFSGESGDFTDEDTASANGTGKGPEAFRRLQSQLAELGEYARLYVSAKKDALTASLRRTILWAAIGLVATSIALSTVVTATVLAMLGLAQLTGQALGNRPWAGYLIVGGGLLLLLVVGMLVIVSSLQSKFRKQTVQKYERRHQIQRARFGHDDSQRSRPQV